MTLGLMRLTTFGDKIYCVMKFRYSIWRKTALTGCVLAIPATIFLFIQPDVGAWTHSLEIMAIIFISSLGGLGGLVAILTRTGAVQFKYTDTEKRRFDYKMAKQLAEMERHSSFGVNFSKRYYESFDIENEDSNDSTAC
jgi:hypothetical protein